MRKSPGQQTDHAQAAQLGGRRTPKLRVIEPLQLPGEWEIQPGVPRTRGDCAGVARPCPHLGCRHHLWLRLQSENPGNPQRGRQGPTTFRPITNETCALDVAERGAEVEEIAKLLGCDATRVRQLAASGLEKLRSLGVDVDQMLEAL